MEAEDWVEVGNGAWLRAGDIRSVISYGGATIGNKTIRARLEIQTALKTIDFHYDDVADAQAHAQDIIDHLLGQSEPTPPANQHRRAEGE